MATPEYKGKPVAVSGASTGLFGVVWAQAATRKALRITGADVLDREVPVGQAHAVFTEEARLSEPEIQSALDELVGCWPRAREPAVPRRNSPKRPRPRPPGPLRLVHVAHERVQLPMSRVFPSNRERADARRNRERILSAAAGLVNERGIDAFSMDDVAAKACVGKGTLYRRFGDRASLLRALIDEPERDFQDALIRGEPPLGPGAPPLERLHAFGAGMLRLLEQNAQFMRATEGDKAGRYGHPVYAFYQTHVALLLQEILGRGTRTDYLVDSLLAPLSADAFLYQREARGMSVEQITDGWCALATAVVVTAK